MSDEKKNLPAVVPAKRLNKKQLTLAVSRTLKKHSFSPLSYLITQVMPQLEPKQQADVCLAILPYVYPRLASESSVKKRGPKLQVNTQVNVSSPPPPPPQAPPECVTATLEPAPITVDDLLRLAANSPARKE